MQVVSPGRSSLRVLIADDHEIFAQALRAYLEKAYTIVGLVSEGRAMVKEGLRLRPDIIIVDVAMPILNGLDAARKIHEQDRNIKFIFLTMQDDPNLAAAALELGPVAFVLKHSAGTELQLAIEHVLRGKPYITPKMRSEDWVEAKARGRQYSKELSPRQREVVQLFGEGRSLKEIADLLNLSEKTVEFHKHHIMESFRIKSNADLVLFALKHGLISLNPEPVYNPRGSSGKG
ncbi:MAG TPA: response regulator transcription factor [Candidatus Sulfotelmatobacter sp.]|jgi:DNA-binding NarL/FixJ family response regulator|nr:response regulator transcription factor [Candidatus Sulfotelmatobacter sp.]